MPNKPKFFFFWGWWGMLDFLCSYGVLTKFPQCSHQILNGFTRYILEFLNVFLTMFPKAPHFVPYVLFSSKVIYMGEYWDLYVCFYVWVNTLILVSLQNFRTFVCDGPIKKAHFNPPPSRNQKKKNWTLKAPVNKLIWITLN
jgi:hypothetical protein